jgi:Holliday junction resolvasome RuvABC DNA-binding subunit
LPALVPVELVGKAAGKSPASGSGELLLKALVNMGYRPAEAERAVKHLGARVEGEPMGDLLRAALAFLTT